MQLRHVIESQQFSREMLDELFITAESMEQVAKQRSQNLLAGYVMASLFYEPSLRTRFSFEAAMLRLGGQVIGSENAGEFSSAIKGESIEHTVRVVSAYADVIALRHPLEGAAARAAYVDRVPIINGGDGTGQHPTQAILDLYTILKEVGSIDDISIAMVGDLARGRTVRSLAYLLSKYRPAVIYFVAPHQFRMRDDIKQYLTEHGIRWSETTRLSDVAQRVNIIYATRIQTERTNPHDLHPWIQMRTKLRNLFSDQRPSIDYRNFVIDGAFLSQLPPKTVIMHPLPINSSANGTREIMPEVDDDPRAAYFRQAENGLYIRMAILKHILLP